MGVLIFLFTKKKINLDLKNKKTQTSMYYIVITTICSSLIAHYFYFKTLSKATHIILVVLITYIVPLIIITLLSNYFLKEKINTGMLIGLLLCIVGVSIFICYSNN